MVVLSSFRSHVSYNREIDAIITIYGHHPKMKGTKTLDWLIRSGKLTNIFSYQVKESRADPSVCRSSSWLLFEKYVDCRQYPPVFQDFLEKNWRPNNLKTYIKPCVEPCRHLNLASHALNILWQGKTPLWERGSWMRWYHTLKLRKSSPFFVLGPILKKTASICQSSSFDFMTLLGVFTKVKMKLW